VGQLLVHGLGWCPPTACRSWPAAETVGDCVEFFGKPAGQVAAVRGILPQEPSSLRVRAPLPGTTRDGESYRDSVLDGEFAVIFWVFAPVPRERSERLLGRFGRRRC
jgi:hypothetical protein